VCVIRLQVLSFLSEEVVCSNTSIGTQKSLDSRVWGQNPQQGPWAEHTFTFFWSITGVAATSVAGCLSKEVDTGDTIIKETWFLSNVFLSPEPEYV